MWTILEVRRISVEFRGTLRPLYLELLNNPPEGIEYHVYNPTYSMLVRKFWDKTWLPGKAARRVYWRLRYNRIIDKQIVHLSNYWDYSVIRMRRRFVADTENVGTFVHSWRFQDLLSPQVRDSIEKSIRSPYCKKIMPLTHAAKKTMEAILDLRGVDQKIEVVYPAIGVLGERKKEKHDEVKILFVGNNFLIKGGRELLDAFRKIRGKYDATLTIVSEEAYRTVPPEEKVEILPSTPRETLLSQFFPSADIFCLPTYSDSFGFVFLEAMAAGIPIISTNHFHVPEIVEDWKTGFLIRAPISSWNADFTYNPKWHNALENMRFPEAVSELEERLSTLIEDTSLRNEMGKRASKEVREGKFSKETRNKKIRSIYEKAADSVGAI